VAANIMSISIAPGETPVTNSFNASEGITGARWSGET